MGGIIKLSAPEAGGYWEIPVLFEDEHLLALDKPSELLTSPDRYDPNRPNLMKLLHRGIERRAPWAKERGLSYLSNAHRLDFETSGVILLAKDKPTLVQLANLFGSEQTAKTYLALAHGNPPDDNFTVDKKLAPHPLRVGLIQIDEKRGKKASTSFKVLQRLGRFALIECHPATGRTHQIRVHLKSVRHPIVGDSLYGGKPLLLSSLKPGYRQKPNVPEKPLMGRVALHAAELAFVNPANRQPVSITAPWPRDLSVAVKYLRKFTLPDPGSAVSQEPDQSNTDDEGGQQ